VTGRFWAFDFASQGVPDFWELGRTTITGVSIFEYPWQIIVLGLLMGTLAVAPVLTAQLMSFGHSFIFVLAVFFLANYRVLPCSDRQLFGRRPGLVSGPASRRRLRLSTVDLWGGSVDAGGTA
jgi:hypothetical protein